MATKPHVSYKFTDESGVDHLSVTIRRDGSDGSIGDLRDRLEPEWVFRSASVPVMTEIVNGDTPILKSPGVFVHCVFERYPKITHGDES